MACIRPTVLLPWNKLQQLQQVTKRQLSMEVFEGGTQHWPLPCWVGIAAHSTDARRADRQLHFGDRADRSWDFSMWIAAWFNLDPSNSNFNYVQSVGLYSGICGLSCVARIL